MRAMLTVEKALVVEHEMKEGAVHIYAAVVMDKAQLFEFIHECTDPWPGGSNHFRKRRLTYLGNQGLGFPSFAVAGKE